MVEGWKKINLGEKCNFERGIEPGSSKYNTSGRGRRFLRVSDLTDLRDDFVFVDINTDKILKKGDICLSLDGTPGIVRDDLEGIYSTGIRKVKFSEKQFNKKFIYYILKSHNIQKIIELYSSGSTIIHAGKSTKYFDVKIPSSLLEQQKIAEILTKVDETIEATEKIIKKNERIKKGLMQDLFSKGIDENGNLRSEETYEFKDSDLGKIPREWDVELIRSISEVKGGKRLPQGHLLVKYETKYPYIRVADFKDNSVNLKNIMYLKKETQNLISRYIINKNDVYISIAGTIGLVGTIPKCLNGANLTENAAKLTNISEQIDKNYLSYFLSSFQSQKQIEMLVGLAVQPKLALFRIEQIVLPRPKLKEQKKITSILTSIASKIQKEKQELNKLKRIKKGLMQDLLTGKVRVNHLIERNNYE